MENPTMWAHCKNLPRNSGELKSPLALDLYEMTSQWSTCFLVTCFLFLETDTTWHLMNILLRSLKRRRLLHFFIKFAVKLQIITVGAAVKETTEKKLCSNLKENRWESHYFRDNTLQHWKAEWTHTWQLWWQLWRTIGGIYAISIKPFCSSMTSK